MKNEFKCIALVLCIILVLSPVTVLAAAPDEVSPAASYLIGDYLGYCKNQGNGTIRVVCDITAKYTIDQLGASHIEIQRYNSTTGAWSYFGTIYGSSYNNLLRTNTGTVLQGVNLEGLTPNRTYRAIIKFYAKNGSIEESRYYTTDSIYIT